MKRPFVIIAVLGIAVSVALAFSLLTGNEFNPDPPARSLPEAYGMALKALGPATNEYYCVSAMRSNDLNFVGGWIGGWDFTFDRNYMQHKLVYGESEYLDLLQQLARRSKLSHALAATLVSSVFIAVIGFILLLLSPDPSKDWGFWFALGFLTYAFAVGFYGSLFFIKLFRKARRIEEPKNND
jgi:hypothetical protein